jgi:hypothetical protein
METVKWPWNFRIENMTNYQNGAAWERKAKQYLEDKGYFVIRSAGSHGIADLAAFGYGKCYLIQVKGPGANISPAEKTVFKRLDLPGFVERALWARKGGEWVIENIS